MVEESNLPMGLVDPMTSVVVRIGLVMFGLAVGCGSTKAPARGTEGGDCLPGGSCIAPLKCFSNLCVRFDGGAGAGTAGVGAAGAGSTGASDGGGAGLTGQAGDAGTTGPTGVAGATGAAGSGGASAVGGATGAAGVSGRSGSSGTAGADASADAGESSDGDAGVDAVIGPMSCVGSPQCFVPTELVPATVPCDGVHLALAGPQLFWTNKAAQTVSKIDVTTNVITPLETNQNAPTLIAANEAAQGAFYVVGGNQVAGTVQGSALGLPSTAPNTIGGLVPTMTIEATIYFTSGSGIYFDGQYQATQGAMEASGTIGAIAINNDNGIVATVTTAGNVDVVNPYPVAQCAVDETSAEGKSCTRVATNQDHLLLTDVHFIDNRVYWANGASVYAVPDYAPSSSPAPIATTAHGGDVASFFVAGSSIFLAEEGFIELARVGGAVTATPIAAGQVHPSSVVGNGDNVYWTRSDCAIEALRHE